MRPPSNESGAFGIDITNLQNNPAYMMCQRLAGRGIVRVVGRCKDAQENNNLDLSECQLMHVPDAVYHLMRHTTLKCCNLSSNVITKITPKFAVKFSLITELNLSHNQMSKLPDELSDLEKLERLDISHNSYISLPNVVFQIPHLKYLNAQHNYILDVEVESILNAPALEEIDLQENPLTPRCHQNLSRITMLSIKLSPRREKQEWEDLTI
ncbi:UNVERIFIED_CONTAM: hypothetical protein PYX00_003560 [Menopon gallinae]|uniref:Leucine-rich repeat-containing protein 20 n=1 Tax=Menopon gallinae TaxID=328185 RepID=A0AAW2I245_9NEOP